MNKFIGLIVFAIIFTLDILVSMWVAETNNVYLLTDFEYVGLVSLIALFLPIGIVVIYVFLVCILSASEFVGKCIRDKISEIKRVK